MMENKEDVENTLSIGSGSDIFLFTISIHSVHNLKTLELNQLSRSNNIRCWLSYSIMNMIVQTEEFCLMNLTTQENKENKENIEEQKYFDPVSDIFRVKSSKEEFRNYFQSLPSLKIYLCSKDDIGVIGFATISLNSLFEDINGKIVKSISGNFPIIPKNSPTRLKCGDKMQAQENKILPLIKVSIDVETKNKKVENNVKNNTNLKKDPVGRGCFHLESNDQKINERNILQEHSDFSNFIQKEVNLNTITLEIDQKKLEWEKWKHVGELKFHEKLKEKESEMLKKTELRISKIEAEANERINQTRMECSQLQGRLRKSLADVEMRERKLHATEMIRQLEYTQKLSEIESDQRRTRDDSEHAIKLEKTKSAAAKEHLEMEKRTKKAAEVRARAAEEELERQRLKLREMPESVLLQELATLKGKLGDAETRAQREKAEKNIALMEKEKLNSEVHHLVSDFAVRSITKQNK